MKKQILKFGAVAVIALSGIAFTSCGGGEEAVGTEEHEHAEAAVYQCPMKCEGEKTYDEAGSCPVCGMDIKEVEHSH